MRSYFERLFTQAYNPWTILIELALIGTVVYVVLRFLHGTRGARLMQGMALLTVMGFLILKVLAQQFDWERIDFLSQAFVWTVFLTTIVVFQPELRQGLMRLGGPRVLRRLISDADRMAKILDATCRTLASRRIGAIMAVERDVRMSNLAASGERLDAELSQAMLLSIFLPGAPLHDMGVIVRNGRIVAARCQFPLAESDDVRPVLGSRHRAAVGLSKDSDAIVIVVSEETGAISIAEGGRLIYDIPPEDLLRMLRDRLSPRRRATARRRKARDTLRKERTAGGVEKPSARTAEPELRTAPPTSSSRPLSPEKEKAGSAT